MRIEIYDNFEDQGIPANAWNKLLSKSQSDVIFMTWEWQSAWWQAFGRGRLMICIVYEEEKAVLIAPLFSDGGMLFFVGSGGSDYLDFIGDINDFDKLENLLVVASNKVSDFIGFRFYHMPAESQSSKVLEKIALINNWNLFLENEMVAPNLNIAKNPELIKEAINKKSLVRHENWFKKNGDLQIQHFSNANEVLAYLEDFFVQHINRWNITEYPSLFNEHAQKEFFKLLCSAFSDSSYLRFTRVVWQNASIAFHFGFNFKGSYLWYKPSFDIELQKHSPGEVLLKNLLQQALQEDAKIFDFGIGDETFKKRFASDLRIIRDWGLYPSNVLKENLI